jgi:hypothetical protein
MHKADRSPLLCLWQIREGNGVRTPEGEEAYRWNGVRTPEGEEAYTTCNVSGIVRLFGPVMGGTGPALPQWRWNLGKNLGNCYRGG